MLSWLKSWFASADNSEPVTLEDLQGTWKMVGVGRNGNFAPLAMVAKMKITMTIQGNRYTITKDGEIGDRGTIALDASQNPVHFDQTITEGSDAGDVHLGLVRLQEGLLENLQGEAGNPRPKKFASKWSDGASLASFRKVSKV